MDLRNIEMFQMVMLRGSVTEAARALGVTQPAVSAALTRLEKEVGFALFRREGRHIAPTQEARLFHVEATRAISGFEGLAGAAASISAATRGTMTIASNPAPAISWLPPIVAEFQRSRPDTRIRFISRSSREVRELATVDGFDIGLAEAPFIRQDAVVRRYRLTMVVALHPQNPLVDHDVITPSILSGQPLITVSGALWTDAAIARAFEVAGADFRIVAECEYIATALGLVANGAGVCFADPISAEQFAAAGVVTRRFEPAIQYEIGLLRSTRGKLSRLAQAFTELLDQRVARFTSGDTGQRYDGADC
jgi:DNA-binding transcriptional LysR family regulator